MILKLDKPRRLGAHIQRVQYYQGCGYSSGSSGYSWKSESCFPIFNWFFAWLPCPAPNACSFLPRFFRLAFGILLFFGSTSSPIKSFQLQQDRYRLESEAIKNRIRSNYSQFNSIDPQEQVIRLTMKMRGSSLLSMDPTQPSFLSRGRNRFFSYAQLWDNSRIFTLQYLQSRLRTTNLIIWKLIYLIADEDKILFLPDLSCAFLAAIHSPILAVSNLPKPAELK